MPICGKCHREAAQGALFCSFCGGAIKPDGDGESDPLIGTTVASKYFVHQLLGRGGMGDVYKATHITLDRPVVVKLLKKSFLSDPSLVQRFHREARAASRLNHPNSINIIDFGQAEDGTLFMAMEFLSGRSLAVVITEDWPLPEERIVHMGAQMLSALAEAHALGVIHRDLKPANVMLEPRRDDPDFVKVLDFGIAKLNEPGENAARLTQAGTVCGTPGYMSPEQVYGEELDARSDLYAVGVILYEMITGLQPFEADTTMGLVTKHLNEPPPPLEERRPGVLVSPDLANIVMWALQKNRNDRPSSAEEMRAHLLAATIRREGAPRTPIGVPKATMVFDPAQLKSAPPRTPLGVQAPPPPAPGAAAPRPATPTPAKKTPVSQPGMAKAFSPQPGTPRPSQPGIPRPSQSGIPRPSQSGIPKVPPSQPGLPKAPVAKTPAPQPFAPKGPPSQPGLPKAPAQKTPSQTFALGEAAPQPKPAVPKTPGPRPAAAKAPTPHASPAKAPAPKAPPAPRAEDDGEDREEAPRAASPSAARSRLPLIAGGAAAALVLVVLVVWGVTRGPRTEPRPEPKQEAKAEPKAADAVRPSIVSTSPPDAAIRIPVDQVITVAFSEPMATDTLRLRLDPTLGLGAPTWSPDGRTFTVRAAQPFSPKTTYSMMVQATDLAGNALAGASTFRFTTKEPATAPAIVSTSPADGASRVPARAPIAVTFSKAMDPATVVLAVDGTRAGSLAWSANGTVATIAPGAFPPDRPVEVEVSGKDLEGIAIAPQRFSFRTAPAAVERPAHAKGIREKRSGVASIAVPPPRSGEGVLAIDATPWAVVFVDGERVLETPCSLRLGAGTYRVRAEYLPEFGPREKVVTIAPGKRELWTLTFAR